MSGWNQVGDGIWVRTYLFGTNPLLSSAVSLGDGGLLVVSPGTNVPEADYLALDAIGTVKALVSPGAFHNMGLPAWHARYPDAGLYGPDSAITHIAKAHKSLPALQPLSELAKLLPADVVAEEMPEMKVADLLLIVTREDGTTWFTNEILTNTEAYPKNPLFHAIFRMTGSGPGLNINTFALTMVRAKKGKVRSYLEAKLASDPPTRLVPCHGTVLDDANMVPRMHGILAKRLG